MKVRVIIKPGSRQAPKIVAKNDCDGEYFEVFVREPAIEGRANRAAIEILSQKFGVPKTRIKLKLGQKTKLKIFEIT